MLCTLIEVIIKQLIEDSFSFVNEVAAMMQENIQAKKVRFVDEMDKKMQESSNIIDGKSQHKNSKAIN